MLISDVRLRGRLNSPLSEAAVRTHRHGINAHLQSDKVLIYHGNCAKCVFFLNTLMSPRDFTKLSCDSMELDTNSV